jgi:hypothetical protein
MALSLNRIDDRDQNGEYDHSGRHATTGDHMNPNPDYDASDEVEYGIQAIAWLLRGVYPPPSYAPELGAP